jgi:hypothetical protein
MMSPEHFPGAIPEARPTLSGGMAPGSGFHRCPVIRCRLLMPGLGVGNREKRGER